MHSEEASHGRVVARRTELPTGPIHRELGKFAAVSLLKHEQRNNHQVYSAKTAGLICTESARILHKTSSLADDLARAPGKGHQLPIRILPTEPWDSISVA